MLDEALRPHGFDTVEKESWDGYRARLRLPHNEAILQFYRQVVYDHFSHFNDHYPEFVLADYTIELAIFTAQEAKDQIRYFRGDDLDFWGLQYDEFEKRNQDYLVFQAMSKSKTFPFPPIIVDPRRLPGTGWRECGRPLHLIEGTH